MRWSCKYSGAMSDISHKARPAWWGVCACERARPGRAHLWRRPPLDSSRDAQQAVAAYLLRDVCWKSAIQRQAQCETTGCGVLRERYTPPGYVRTEFREELYL